MTIKGNCKFERWKVVNKDTYIYKTDNTYQDYNIGDIIEIPWFLDNTEYKDAGMEQITDVLREIEVKLK